MPRLAGSSAPADIAFAAASGRMLSRRALNQALTESGDGDATLSCGHDLRRCALGLRFFHHAALAGFELPRAALDLRRRCSRVRGLAKRSGELRCLRERVPVRSVLFCRGVHTNEHRVDVRGAARNLQRVSLR